MFWTHTKDEQIPHGFISTVTPVFGHKVHAFESCIPDCKQTIVLIHGALASRRYLMPTAMLLARSANVYVPEMPGHGASSKPKHALSVKEQAEILSEWFKLRALIPSNIFANSYGCQVVAQLVSTHPEVASSIILSDPTTDPAARNMLEEAFRFYLNGFFEPQGAIWQLLADLGDMGIPLAYETVQRMLEDDIRPKLAKIKCRAMVIRGEKDPIAPEKWTEEVAQHIPDAQFRIIANAPHCINYATPVQLSKMILEFINEDTKVYSKA